MKKRSLLSKFILTSALSGLLGITTMNAQTLKHSYTFEDGTANDVVGNVNGTVSGGVFENGGYVMFAGDEFIEFDAAAIALNEYESITVETYVKRGENADGEYNAVWSFNGYRASNDYLLSIVRGSNTCQTEVNGLGAAGPEPVNGETHHYVSILTKQALKLYIDGVLVSEKATSGDLISNIGTHPDHPATAYIGKSTWPDKSFKGTIYEWNIYEGELDNSTIYTHAKDFGVVTDDSKLKSLSVTNGSLYPSFNPSVTEYTAVLNPGTTSMDVLAVAFEEGALVMDGNSNMDLSGIDVSDESGDITISVITDNGQTDYSIHYLVNTDLTLKHSYDFEDAFAVNDVVGGANGTTTDVMTVFDGAWHADGDQSAKIVLDPAAIAINTYPSITFEGHVTLGENGGYTILYYFGGNGNDNATLLRLTDGSDANESWAQISANNDVKAYAACPEQEPFTTHHYVVVMSYGYVKYYLDGALVSESQISDAANFISNVGTEVAYLGVGTWDDPLLVATVEEFNIYSGEMDAATVAQRCEAYGITPTGVEKTVAKISTLYPTVSNDVFNVEFKDQSGTITVYDLSGNVIKQIQPDGLSATFTVDNPGIYLVQVVSEGVTNTYKVVKK
ncbi:LamG-like jellyroll fold domain-containing protein [Plebeiibacterium marinum]|uniref:T9SS type A sorting domain-containing protein n=1 Tax=Plebeiibacterium marinum TaxID=2992111 RepID=A0AAE3MBM4_9BACT|nr:LamG-like jellyroll fold domain-containing protein [Plebeiobacterium marinum]MCW3804466.1 T9SS type A sorting domain-containing protein [Plebeiobacterium marinum]